MQSDSKVVDIIEWKIDLLLNKKLNNDFSNAYNIVKLRNNFLILINKLVELKMNWTTEKYNEVREEAIKSYIDFKKSL